VTAASVPSLDARSMLRASFLEYHHVRLIRRGGAATTTNIQLRCTAHNAYEAALFFGDDSLL
jgi:hypothetical protein